MATHEHKGKFWQYVRTTGLLLLALISGSALLAQNFETKVRQQAAAMMPATIEWRHTLHQNPELSNREFNTAKMVAQHLEGLGLEVHTGIAHTGVVGVLKTGKPGPTVALRADMDALPVKERTNLPYKSEAVGTYNGKEVPVMHACGHDTHVAILMSVAQVLTNQRKDLKGNVVFIFQPAEEGAPEGEEGGAALMVKEGVLERFGIDVIFGLHINAQTPVGHIRVRPTGIMAAADVFTITVNGKQTHGSTPWSGVDPIVASAQIINGLQTIISRQQPLTKQAAVITVGSIHGGVRNNIIPEQVKLVGTIRTLDTAMQQDIHRRIENTATMIAQSSGATAQVSIKNMCPVTYNAPDLYQKMLPVLQMAVGPEKVHDMDAITGAEDFAFFQEKVPGLYFFIGGMPPNKTIDDMYPHHTPDFFVDDSGMKTGIVALSLLTQQYMQKH